MRVVVGLQCHDIRVGLNGDYPSPLGRNFLGLPLMNMITCRRYCDSTASRYHDLTTSVSAGMSADAETSQCWSDPWVMRAGYNSCCLAMGHIFMSAWRLKLGPNLHNQGTFMAAFRTEGLIRGIGQFDS
jgi:hypothetical protein